LKGSLPVVLKVVKLVGGKVVKWAWKALLWDLLMVILKAQQLARLWLPILLGGSIPTRLVSAVFDLGLRKKNQLKLISNQLVACSLDGIKTTHIPSFFYLCNLECSIILLQVIHFEDNFGPQMMDIFVCLFKIKVRQPSAERLSSSFCCSFYRS
jgi:hypothetical protein